MLVLSRTSEPGKNSIMIDGVEVRVLSVVDGKVRLGFIGPRSVDIVRTELVTRQVADTKR